MPEKSASIAPDTDHRMDRNAQRELERHYLTELQERSYGQHRQQLEDLNQLLPTPIDDLEGEMGDFARGVQEEVAALQIESHNIAKDLLEDHPELVAQTDKFARLIVRQLKELPHNVLPETLRTAADMAIELVTDPYKIQRKFGRLGPNNAN